MVVIIVLGILTAGLLCVAYGVFIERTWFHVVRHRLAILPAGTPAVTVLHLSDLHFRGADRRKGRFIRSLPQPDVAIVTGDLLGEPEGVEPVVAALRAVRGRIASYFVLGSNDYYAPRPLNYLHYFVRPSGNQRRPTVRNRTDDLIEALEADGWEHLRNRRTELRLGDTAIEVLGLDDPHVHRQDARDIPRGHPERFGLVVVHSPDPAPELASFGYDLIVSGHTHGGQVRLPLIGALVTNCSLPRRFSRGLSRLGHTYLHVSPGAGTSKFAPFRFLCRPEATILELHPVPARVTSEPQPA